MKSPHWIPIVHRVKRCDFIYSHGRHFESFGDLIHDAYTGETMLPLAEIEQGHYSGLLVLWRITFEDLGNELLTDGIELEWDFWIIFWRVAMLYQVN
jgi:hypothetical protein